MDVEPFGSYANGEYSAPGATALSHELLSGFMSNTERSQLDAKTLALTVAGIQHADATFAKKMKRRAVASVGIALLVGAFVWCATVFVRHFIVVQYKR